MYAGALSGNFPVAPGSIALSSLGMSGSKIIFAGSEVTAGT
jgi:hypothetical protein